MTSSDEKNVADEISKYITNNELTFNDVSKFYPMYDTYKNDCYKIFLDYIIEGYYKSLNTLVENGNLSTFYIYDSSKKNYTKYYYKNYLTNYNTFYNFYINRCQGYAKQKYTQLKETAYKNINTAITDADGDTETVDNIRTVIDAAITKAKNNLSYGDDSNVVSTLDKTKSAIFYASDQTTGSKQSGSIYNIITSLNSTYSSLNSTKDTYYTLYNTINSNLDYYPFCGDYLNEDGTVNNDSETPGVLDTCKAYYDAILNCNLMSGGYVEMFNKYYSIVFGDDAPYCGRSVQLSYYINDSTKVSSKSSEGVKTLFKRITATRTTIKTAESYTSRSTIKNKSKKEKFWKKKKINRREKWTSKSSSSDFTTNETTAVNTYIKQTKLYGFIDFINTYLALCAILLTKDEFNKIFAISFDEDTIVSNESGYIFNTFLNKSSLEEIYKEELGTEYDGLFGENGTLKDIPFKYLVVTNRLFFTEAGTGATISQKLSFAKKESRILYLLFKLARDDKLNTESIEQLSSDDVIFNQSDYDTWAAQQTSASSKTEANYKKSRMNTLKTTLNNYVNNDNTVVYVAYDLVFNVDFHNCYSCTDLLAYEDNNSDFYFNNYALLLYTVQNEIYLSNSYINYAPVSSSTIINSSNIALYVEKYYEILDFDTDYNNTSITTYFQNYTPSLAYGDSSAIAHQDDNNGVIDIFYTYVNNFQSDSSKNKPYATMCATSFTVLYYLYGIASKTYYLKICNRITKLIEYIKAYYQGNLVDISKDYAKINGYEKIFSNAIFAEMLANGINEITNTNCIYVAFSADGADQFVDYYYKLTYNKQVIYYDAIIQNKKDNMTYPTSYAAHRFVSKISDNITYASVYDYETGEAIDSSYLEKPKKAYHLFCSLLNAYGGPYKKYINVINMIISYYSSFVSGYISSESKYDDLVISEPTLFDSKYFTNMLSKIFSSSKTIIQNTESGNTEYTNIPYSTEPTINSLMASYVYCVANSLKYLTLSFPNSTSTKITLTIESKISICNDGEESPALGAIINDKDTSGFNITLNGDDLDDSTGYNEYKTYLADKTTDNYYTYQTAMKNDIKAVNLEDYTKKSYETIERVKNYSMVKYLIMTMYAGSYDTDEDNVTTFEHNRIVNSYLPLNSYLTSSYIKNISLTDCGASKASEMSTDLNSCKITTFDRYISYINTRVSAVSQSTYSNVFDAYAAPICEQELLILFIVLMDMYPFNFVGYCDSYIDFQIFNKVCENSTIKKYNDAEFTSDDKQYGGTTAVDEEEEIDYGDYLG